MVKMSMSKWSKYKVLKKSNGLVPHLPETSWMKESSFWRLLNKYGELILKPAASSGGHGVLLVTSLGKLKYEVQDGSRKKRIHGKTNLLAYVKKRTTTSYIVQRRISLASVNRCPYDLRVMVQRRPKSSWQVTGKLAKVAGKGFIITNMRRSNGRILPVQTAINRSVLKRISTRNLLSTIDRVALSTAEQLKRYYPSIRTIGIDMGLDVKGKVWIIEANFAPMNALFLKLKDKTMYRKIMSYSRRSN